MNTRAASGFALPTVIIVGTILFGMMSIILGSVASTRAVLDAQFYEALARDAAESGAAHARACFDDVNFTPSVTLTPKTNCAGVDQGGLSLYVTDTTAASASLKYRTSYQASVTVSNSFGKSIAVTGSTELVRASGGSVWKTYNYTLRGDASGGVLASSVTFGYANSLSGVCVGGHFMVVTDDNRIMAVGNNTCGQLGVNNITNQLLPVEVQLPSGVKMSTTVSPAVFMNVRSGGVHSAIIGSDGYAYIAGRNYAGHTGWGDTLDPIPTFRRFGGVSETYGPVSYIGLFSTNVYVVEADGEAWAAGLCTDGLGGSNYTISGCTHLTTPQPIGGAGFYDTNNDAKKVVRIVGDNSSRHAIMKDGTLYAWGDNATGALGITSAYTQTSQPRLARYANSLCGTTLPFGGANVRAVEVYDNGGSSFVLGDNGVLYSAGGNTTGMLGYGFNGNNNDCSPSTSSTSSGYFVYSPFFAFNPALAANEKIVKAATDQNVIAILTSDHDVYTAGENYYGTLGCGQYLGPSLGVGCPPNAATAPPQNPNDMKTATAQRFILPDGVSGEDVIAPMSVTSSPPLGVINSANVFVLGSDGAVYGAGTGDYGQLGNNCGGSCQLVNPTPIKMALPSGVVAVSVTGGRATTVVRATDGLYYATGLNDTGQLGSGNLVNSSVPTAYRYMNIHDVRYF